MSKSHLRACPACARHVRVTEAACPFCGGALGESFRESQAPLGPGVRLTRAALFAFGTGTLAIAPGCSGTTTTSTPFYGASPIESVDGGDDGGHAGEPLYGGPPTEVDAGSEDAGTDSGGGFAPVYGSPPLKDGGH